MLNGAVFGLYTPTNILRHQYPRQFEPLDLEEFSVATYKTYQRPERTRCAEQYPFLLDVIYHGYISRLVSLGDFGLENVTYSLLTCFIKSIRLPPSLQWTQTIF